MIVLRPRFQFKLDDNDNINTALCTLLILNQFQSQPKDFTSVKYFNFGNVTSRQDLFYLCVGILYILKKNCLLMESAVTTHCIPNWMSSFRGLMSAADADMVSEVVGVVLAGTVFFTGVSLTIARPLNFWLGVRDFDTVSPTHFPVGIAVVEIVVMGTVTVSL